MTRTEHTVPGDPEVRVRVHRPRGILGALPAVVSLHGGGDIVGNYNSGDPLFDGFRDECVTYVAVRHAQRDLDDWIARQLAV